MMCTGRLTAHRLRRSPAALWKRDGSQAGNTHTTSPFHYMFSINPLIVSCAAIDLVQYLKLF